MEREIINHKLNLQKQAVLSKLIIVQKSYLAMSLTFVFLGGQNKPYPLIPSFQRLDEVHRCIAYIRREEFKAFFKLTPYFQILTLNLI